MERWTQLIVLFTLHMAGTRGQTVYDSKNFYKPMTENFDVRLRGELFLPPCVKNLMNCWEVIKPDLVCNYGMSFRQLLESMCMDLRLHCVEFLGPLPFDKLDVSPWNFCPIRITDTYALNLDPKSRGVNFFEWEG